MSLQILLRALLTHWLQVRHTCFSQCLSLIPCQTVLTKAFVVVDALRGKHLCIGAEAFVVCRELRKIARRAHLMHSNRPPGFVAVRHSACVEDRVIMTHSEVSSFVTRIEDGPDKVSAAYQFELDLAKMYYAVVFGIGIKHRSSRSYIPSSRSLTQSHIGRLITQLEVDSQLTAGSKYCDTSPKS